jgi:uncharacterized membrane protein (DUF106 family)
MIDRFSVPLGVGSIVGLTVSTAIQATVSGAPVMLVPTVNLVAIVTGAIAMGMIVNRVKQLERRMDKVQDRVFRESDDSSDDTERRASEGRRKR